MNDHIPHHAHSEMKYVRYAAAAALSVLALFLLVLTFDSMSRFGKGDNPPLNTITVTGEGRATAVPDIARISFTVQETASNVAAAQDAATKRTNDAIAAVGDLGVEDKDVKTTGYNVYPQYENQQPCYPGALCPTGTPAITGYQVSQSIEVTVRDTAKAGDVLQKLGTLGVQNISGPTFTVDDDSSVSDDAREKAIDDAREKAKVLAHQLGVHLGDVVSFSESGNYPQPMYAKGGATMDSVMMRESAAPTLPVGQDETTITVSVTYEIR